MFCLCRTPYLQGQHRREDKQRDEANNAGFTKDACPERIADKARVLRAQAIDLVESVLEVDRAVRVATGAAAEAAQTDAERQMIARDRHRCGVQRAPGAR